MEQNKKKFKINDLVAGRFDGMAYMIVADKEIPYTHAVPTDKGDIVTKIFPNKNSDYVMRQMGIPAEAFRPFVHASEDSLLHLVDTDIKTKLSSGEFQVEGINIEFAEFSFPDLSGRKKEIVLFSDGRQSTILYTPEVESLRDMAAKEATRLGWIPTK